MERISKPPEIRRQEILDSAMKLFCEKGYESTSMADIAQDLHIVQGLCYRYFPSKQNLFETAMQQYVEECSEAFIKIIHDHSRTIQERMNAMSALMQDEKNYSRYHEFYHKAGNETLHEMLTIRMCSYMIPHVCEELEYLCSKGIIRIENPELLTGFIMYGQICLLKDREGPSPEKLLQIQQYIETLLGLRIPDSESRPLPQGTDH
jgi:AcrR family transcriptional regulator